MAETQQIRILAVDDDPDGLFALETLLKENGFEVITASNGTDAYNKLETHLPDVALLDVMMPGMDGFTVVKKAKSDPVLRYIPLILLTARANLDDILHGFELGADDYIKKPFDRTELLARLNAILRVRAIYRELESTTEYNKSLRAQVDKVSPYAGTDSDMIGKSAAMKNIADLISKVAVSKLPVLINGESGTGKELVARAIHSNSDRKDKPFLVQNCSTFNENLLESELFGHVKGAYTGAQSAKRGLFEVADGGTFFLDELGEMSPALQAKLLRVLQDGTFIPVGDTREKKVDVRIVAATNKDLKKLISEDKFREDLYYRINVVNIKLPPLRERREDIQILIEHFLKNSPHNQGQPKKIDSDALKVLMDYDWPGNIRQLQNELERLIVLCSNDSTIGKDNISPEILSSENVVSSTDSSSTAGKLKEAMSSLEKKIIEESLQRNNGNKSETARELGISRSNLISKVQEYGLDAS